MPAKVTRFELEDKAWAHFVNSAADASPFHHPTWARLLADCYGYPAFALAVTDAAGEITAGLPVIEVSIPFRGRKWVSLPFTDICPPLARTADATQHLMGALRRQRFMAGARSLEFRAEVDGGHGYAEEAGVIHRLHLESDADAVFRRFKKSQVQRNIRRAEREDVQVRAARTCADLIDVYYDLHLKTRHRQGVPSQPRRYFKLLWERVIEPGLGSVSIAYAGDRAVAGAVFLAWNGTVIYKYGASDEDYWSLRANHLVFWDAIRRACQNGYHTFDFGRTELSNEGLRAFKSGWGAEELPLRYTVISDTAQAPPGSRDPIAAVLRPVIQRAPAWSCKVLGTLFYKYAA